MNRKVIFCLARGYPNKEMYSYAKLCLRNLAIKRVLGKSKAEWDLLVFHEGNITMLHTMLIKLFSFTRLKFVNVAENFIIPKIDTEELINPGYIAMCRFHYAFVWRYLSDYDTVVRVDDDVILLQWDSHRIVKVFDHAFISGETHKPTNYSLPKYLQSIDAERFYDQEFPYTNFYITRMDFWSEARIQNLLLEISRQEIGIKDRWGDSPVLGVVLKYFGKWKSVELRHDVEYLHLSHRTIVKHGENQTILEAISSKLPMLGTLLKKMRNLTSLKKVK